MDDPINENCLDVDLPMDKNQNKLIVINKEGGPDDNYFMETQQLEWILTNRAALCLGRQSDQPAKVYGC
jgi:hypothetical protein